MKIGESVSLNEEQIKKYKEYEKTLTEFVIQINCLKVQAEQLNIKFWTNLKEELEIFPHEKISYDVKNNKLMILP